MAHSGNFNHKSVCVNQPMSSKSHGARSMILNYLKSQSSDGLLCSCLSASIHNAPICALWSIWHLPESGSVGWNWPLEVALLPLLDSRMQRSATCCIPAWPTTRGEEELCVRIIIFPPHLCDFFNHKNHSYDEILLLIRLISFRRAVSALSSLFSFSAS